MMKPARHPGSVLLLTVMVIAVLTTTTLGAVAIRFEQLAATDKVNSSAVAKLAADSGLARLREKLDSGSSITPTVYDLDRNQEQTGGVDLATFKPSPRSIVSSFEQASTALPRCLAVAVLAPWNNSGRYFIQEDDNSSLAMIFHYANIVNDTPLGVIPENESISSEADKLLPISELTRMGHFYNPFAPPQFDSRQSAYWTVKMGGPEDEFLTRKAANGASSYYSGLDFIYIPYLPRWVDTGLLASSSGTGLDRVSGDELRLRFEQVIKENNFKIWLDPSVKDQVVAEYGLGDLFLESDEYRVQWLQPSLWNDLPEADIAGVYKTENINNTPTDPWTSKPTPLFKTSNGSGGWDLDIARGSKHFSFLRLNTNSQVQLTPGATVSALLYGSLEGVRLNQKIHLNLIRRDTRTPLLLQNRNTDQGRLYGATITGLTIAGNTTTVTLRMSTNTFETPNKLNGAPISAQDLDSIVLTGNGPQFSTKTTLTNATLGDGNGDGQDVQVSFSATSCQPSAALIACPAVGDVVSLNKPGNSPVWGRVESVNFNGSTISSLVIDQARVQPKPVRHQAVTTYTVLGEPMIAYYGGEIVMNDFDGGFNSESDELWLYNPETDAWSYPNQGGVTPGRRAGASILFDALNNRLVLFGGYYREGVTTEPAGNCQLYQALCLNSNQPGLRFAKRVTNDVYAYSLSLGTWEKIDYSFGDGQKIQQGSDYRVRVVSTLGDRSGLERWRWSPRADNSVGSPPIVVNVNGTDTSVIKVTPSAAGIAKGDELYMYSRDPSFNAWARVTDVDYPNDLITIVVHGNIRAASSVTLNELFFQVLTRQQSATNCSGSTSGGYHTCALSGDTTGYAVGDQVVLEQYSANRISTILSGYISHMQGTTLYFVSDERRSDIKDFRDNTGVGRIIGESAVAFPVGRYGGTLQMKPKDPQGGKQINYLYQGASRNLNTYARLNEVWEMQFSAGVPTGPASVLWASTPKGMDNPVPNTSATYNFKVIKSSYQSQVFTVPVTSGSPAPEVVKDKVTTNPQTGAQTIEWDNNKTWDITLQTSGIEAIAPSRLVVDAPIVIERENGPDGPNPNVRETFNGYISNTFESGYNSTIIRVRHNPGYSGDRGLKTHSKNAKVTIFSTMRTDHNLNNVATWVSRGGYLELTTNELSRIPSSGLVVKFWREVNGRIEAYTMSVGNRTYDAGVNKFRLYPDDRPYASPPPLAYATNAVVSHNGNDAFAMSFSDYQAWIYGQGAAEWFVNAKDNNPLWQIRISDPDTDVLNDRPGPRLGGSFATVYNNGTDKSQIFVAGGFYGRYADVWRVDDAGKMNGSDLVVWKIGQASPESSKDLPNLFGAAMVAYQKNNVTKVVHFGGKLKFDISSNDYGRYFGPRLLGRPDTNQWSTKPDNSYYLPDSATVDSAGLVATLQRNFPTTVSSDVTATKNSLKLSGAGIPDYNTKVCSYIGQDCNDGADSSPLMQHLGELGRISADPASAIYGGYSWGRTRAVLNPGTAFLKEGSAGAESARLVMSFSSYSGSTTTGRWDQDGYHPYVCDTSDKDCLNAPYGTTSTNYTSDKTMMLVGFAKISGANQGGAILVTTMGIASSIVTPRGSNDATGRWYSYCADYYYDDPSQPDFACKPGTTRYLRHLPDIEDLVFMFNASLVLSSTDTYKVVGYHGGVKRGYQVVKRPGQDPIVFEIAP